MAQTLGPVAALLLGVFFLVTGSGLQNTLLPLRGAFEGFSAINLGILGSSYYLGFVTGCLAVPHLVRRSGHIRAFAALTAGVVATMLAHPIFVEPYFWFVMRAITGFCFAGLYLVIESWLNDRATNQTRGFVMSAYVMVDYAALTAGQMMITLYPVRSFELFALAAILFSLATLPVVISSSGQPAPIETARIRLPRLFRAAPVAMVGCFVIGLTNGSLWSLGPIFGIGSGLTSDGAATFMSAIVVAGAIAQWPVGFFSDRMDRRRILGALMVGAMLASLALGALQFGLVGLSVLGLVFGALAMPAYSLAAAHAYDLTPASDAVETAAGLLLLYGIGSVVGPAAASFGMQHYGPGALFFFMAGCYALLLLFVVWRMCLGDRRPALKPPAMVMEEGAACVPTGTVPAPDGEAEEAARQAPPVKLSSRLFKGSARPRGPGEPPFPGDQDGRSDGA
ncbi:MFS transporter [Ancylobacter amanitiformis]|uniref:MFS family permease n=1 Tax=Ancylobacter amanitiformis TaxID=217069 RepID=A0ABU0LLF6_9HYPH|nr:MFS transporter [Ancylobacter amanitiformis]MDQ0509532.1 MFS family permease [Ancylobacter amanitiformis]